MPTEVEELEGVVSAAGDGEEQGYSFASTQTGAVFSWGCGAIGTLGHGNRADCTEPTQLGLLGAVQAGL